MTDDDDDAAAVNDDDVDDDDDNDIEAGQWTRTHHWPIWPCCLSASLVICSLKQNVMGARKLER